MVSYKNVGRAALGALALAWGLSAVAVPLPVVSPPPLIDGFKVEWVQVSTSPHSTADALNALAGTGGFTVLDRVTEFRTFINLSDADAPFAGVDPLFAIRVSGYITITAPGSYSFLSIHDDGVRVIVGGELAIDFPFDTGAVETDSPFYDLAAGVYAYEAISWEQGGAFDLALGIDDPGAGRVFLAGAHAPEPGSLALAGLALLGVVAARRRALR